MKEMRDQRFSGIESEVVQEMTIFLQRGAFHNGDSAIIRLFGRRPI